LNKKTQLAIAIVAAVGTAAAVWEWPLLRAAAGSSQLMIYANVGIRQASLPFTASERVAKWRVQEAD
jgi:hypothetical protein